MLTDLLVVMLWQVVLIGGWAASRRLRRLERTFRTPCYGQVGALREQVVELREEQAFDGEEQARRIRGVEASTSRAEAEVRYLIRRHENVSRALMARIGRLERALAGPGPDSAREEVKA